MCRNRPLSGGPRNRAGGVRAWRIGPLHQPRAAELAQGGGTRIQHCRSAPAMVGGLRSGPTTELPTPFWGTSTSMRCKASVSRSKAEGLIAGNVDLPAGGNLPGRAPRSRRLCRHRGRLQLYGQRRALESWSVTMETTAPCLVVSDIAAVAGRFLSLFPIGHSRSTAATGPVADEGACALLSEAHSRVCGELQFQCRLPEMWAAFAHYRLTRPWR